jgi:xanthine dehydrogenase YagR molybdenum-binding subunit
VAELETPPPIRQPLTRVDGRLKVTGAAKYAAEFSPDGLVYAQLIQCTIARGSVVSVDVAEAKALPGVLGVFTRADIPPFHPYPDDATKKGSPGESRVPLQDDEIHFAGQHLGIVVADSLEAVRQAVSVVRVHYAPGRPALRLDDPDANKTAFEPETFVGREKLQVSRGDVAGALAGAKTKIDLTYTTPIENHNPIETYSTIAMWETPERLLVHEATRGIKQLQKILWNALRLQKEDVRIICPFLGGAFGSKGFQWSHILLTAAAAKLVHRPVKLHFTRPQMFDSAGQRAHTSQRVALGADEGGKLVALRHDSTMHCSPVSEYPEACGNMSRMLYSCPNMTVSHRLVRLNYTSPCPMRAPGEAPGVFALECAIDEMAGRLNMDPLEFRLRNYADMDENEKKPWSSKHLRECYERAAKKFGWEKRNPKAGATRAKDGSRVGWGMATSVYPAGQQTAAAKGTIGRDGIVIIRSATHEIGTGTYTTMSQLAAGALGLPIENIRFELGDSEFPEAPTNGGSWLTASVGPAVLGVCSALKKRFREVTRSDWPNDPQRLRDALNAPNIPTIEAEWKSDPDKAEREQFSFQSFGAIFVEVTVDDLGQTRVKRVVSVYDVGRILNPRLARSQIMGATLFGMGMALMEETVPDLNSGRFVNANLAEYHVPTCADTPEFDIDFIDEPDPHMPDLGARGIGEIGIVGAPAAIANAIYHATGKRVRDLPITPDKLLA